MDSCYLYEYGVSDSRFSFGRDFSGIIPGSVSRFDLEYDFSVIILAITFTSLAGKVIRYYFNYSDHTTSFNYPHSEGTELLSNSFIRQNEKIELQRWGFVIIEERQ